MSSFLLFNGHLRPETGFTLPLPNRGLMFSDGFFETLVWTAGRLRYAAHHAARMQRAATALELALPAALASAEALAGTLGALTTDNRQPTTRLRLQLWRGGGGLYAPGTDACEWLATARPFEPQDESVAAAGFAETVRTVASPLAFCKGPQAWLYVLAAQERQQRGLGELLLLDAAGHVAEAVAAAVLWVRGGALFTPHLRTGCVAGVRRAHLLARAQAHGVAVHEVLAVPAEVLAAEAVFTANVAGIRAVARLAETELATEHPLLQQLREWDAV